jgi:hypothetical protein
MPMHLHAVQSAPGVFWYASSAVPGQPVFCGTFVPAVGLLRVEGDWLVVPTAAPVRPVRNAMALCAHTMSCIGLWGSFWLLGRRWVRRCRYRRRRRRVCSCACQG